MANLRKLIALRDITVAGRNWRKGQTFEADEQQAKELTNSGQAEEETASSSSGAGQSGGQGGGQGGSQQSR